VFDVNGAVAIDSAAGNITATVVDAKTFQAGGSDTYVKVSPHGTAGSEKILAQNTAGTGADAIKLHSIAGGITLDGETGINIQENSVDIVTIDTSRNIDVSGATVDVNATGVINVGNSENTGAINVGTGAAARTITVGNTTGATAVNLNAGTGSIALASTGTGASAIALTASHATGGIILTSGGDIVLAPGKEVYLLQMLILYHQ
jgi:hypothetical protein